MNRRAGPRILLIAIVGIGFLFYRKWLRFHWNFLLTTGLLLLLGSGISFVLGDFYGIEIPLAWLFLPLSFIATFGGVLWVIYRFQGLSAEVSLVSALVITVGWFLLVYYMVILASGNYSE